MSKKSATLRSKECGAFVNVLDLCFHEKERDFRMPHVCRQILWRFGAIDTIRSPETCSGSTPGAPWPHEVGDSRGFDMDWREKRKSLEHIDFDRARPSLRRCRTPTRTRVPLLILYGRLGMTQSTRSSERATTATWS
jgi:hypothetical protein